MTELALFNTEFIEELRGKRKTLLVRRAEIRDAASAEAREIDHVLRNVNERLFELTENPVFKNK